MNVAAVSGETVVFDHDGVETVRIGLEQDAGRAGQLETRAGSDLRTCDNKLKFCA